MNLPVTRAVLMVAVAMASAGAQASVIPPADRPRSDQWLFSIDAFGGIPVGEFKEHENGGAGAEGMLGFQVWRRQPLVLRLQGGGLLYSKVDAVSQQCDVFGCQEVRYTARDHSMVFFNFGPEFMATDGPWRPFGYALAGYTFFTSSFHYPPSDLDPNQQSETLFSSHNFSTVYGAGIRRVGTKIGRETGFELAFNVMRNAKARYLNERGVQQNPDGSFTISPVQGAANVLGIHLGFWMGPHVRYWERH